jgi:glucose-6-phosphate 1-dehydrogenase
MRRKLTQIVVTFKPTPHCLFQDMEDDSCPSANRLVINVQPDEGISLRFEGKVPGEAMRIRSAIMDFDYGEQFEAQPPEAYAHLLLEAIEGDRSLYKTRREIEAAWRIVEPVLEAWAESGKTELPSYPAGSWGPTEADRLIAPHGQWRNPEGKVSRSRFIQKQ